MGARFVGMAVGRWHRHLHSRQLAQRCGDTMALKAGRWTVADDAASNPTAYGVNFNQLLTSLGATPGILEHPTITGELAAGWPSW